ncbi:MAG: sulfurtransferase TusA family protein [Planctomycetaceae bacterium]
METKKLDCSGMNCPMPIVEMSKAARDMKSGDLLKVTATDLAFKLDVEAWARKTGHSLESFDQGEIQVACVRIK